MLLFNVDGGTKPTASTLVKLKIPVKNYSLKIGSINKVEISPYLIPLAPCQIENIQVADGNDIYPFEERNINVQFLLTQKTYLPSPVTRNKITEPFLVKLVDDMGYNIKLNGDTPAGILYAAQMIERGAPSVSTKQEVEYRRCITFFSNPRDSLNSILTYKYRGNNKTQ